MVSVCLSVHGVGYPPALSLVLSQVLPLVLSWGTPVMSGRVPLSAVAPVLLEVPLSPVTGVPQSWQVDTQVLAGVVP